MWSRPYVKKFWKPLQFEEKCTSFDRKNLIPLDKGEYNLGKELPEKPTTDETTIIAGNINSSIEKLVPEKLSADAIIFYLKDLKNSKERKILSTNDNNISVNPIRRIRDI